MHELLVLPPTHPRVSQYSLSNVPVAEEELPAEVTLLDDVIVSDGDEAVVAAADAHHCKVLQELTAQGARTDQEQLERLELLLLGAADDSNLRVIPVGMRAESEGREREEKAE